MNENERTLHIDPPKRIQYAAVAAISMLALFLLVETIDGLRNLDVPAPYVTSITVEGTGDAAAIPDTAQITFTVSEDADSVADAQKGATEKIDAALSSLEDSGIEEKDIKTLSYNVSPKYSYPQPCYTGYCPSQEQKIIGYTVSQTVTVKVRDTEKTGEVLQMLGDADVQNISGPNFIVDDDETVKAEARAEAIAEAKAKAEALADELGVSLGRVTGFWENSGPYYPMYEKTYGLGGDSMPAAVPTLPVGENEYSVSVSITYEIR